MKKISYLLFIALFWFCVGNVHALVYHYNDSMIAFPGYFNPLYPDDEIGNPQVEYMDVYVNDTTRELEKVEIKIKSRTLFDSLFINVDWDGSGADWHGWDYFIRQNRNGTGPFYLENAIYSVADPYEYTLATGGRTGHPNGIDKTYLTKKEDFSANWDMNTKLLVYDFTGLSFDIILSEQFSIAYAPWCANDVMGTPIPEPATIFLTGLGLLGIGGFARKKRKKQ